VEARQCGDSLAIMGEPYARGAEAVLLLVEWFGIKAVAKCRIQKPYRHPVLDEKLRTRRTVVEAKAVKAALEAGVNAPSLFLVDPVSALIIMEYIEGKPLSLLIEENPRQAHAYLELLGEETARLHAAGIAHGDLTTSNALAVGDKVYIIDFGLADLKASKLDMAVDVHLFLRSLESTHPEHVDDALASFLKGYRRVLGDKAVEEMLTLVKEIRLMGRYRAERRHGGVEVKMVWGTESSSSPQVTGTR
jgi:TP53 regulating kinase-like protein